MFAAENVSAPESSDSTAAASKKKKDDIIWTTAQEDLLLRAYKSSFIDHNVEYSQKGNEWVKIATSMNAHPCFNCEDPNFVKHDVSKFRQKFTRMKSAFSKKLEQRANKSGNLPMSEGEIILDLALRNLKQKLPENLLHRMLRSSPATTPPLNLD